MNKKLKITLIILIIVLIIFVSLFLYFYLKGPYLKLKGDAVTYLEVTDVYHDAGVKKIGDIGDKKNNTELIYIESNVNNLKIGSYEVKYQYKDKKIVRKVEVVDKTNPVINLKGNNIVNVCSYDSYIEEGYIATDNYDGDLTSKVKTLKINNKIIYQVSDLSNNKGEVIRTLVIKDDVKPVINLDGGEKVIINKGNKYIDKYKAIDNCDLDITNNVLVTGNVDTNKIGEYELKYEVTDSSNNKTEIKRTVIVKEKTMYNGSTIYLTFDDGPSLEVTPYILDILKQNNIKATFFVINHSSNTDYLIKRAYDEGHTIGLHSYSHNYKTIYSSNEDFFNDLDRIEQKVINITGTSTKIIRFPGGSSNTVSKNYKKGIMSSLASEVQNRGYKYFDWNVGSSDTSTNTAEATCSNVKKRLGTGTNIVLMHDFSSKTSNIEALKCIIAYGLDRGYDFDRITSSTKNIHHGIAN